MSQQPAADCHDDRASDLPGTIFAREGDPACGASNAHAARAWLTSRQAMRRLAVTPSAVDQLLHEARRRLRRITARRAATEQAKGALLIDTRSVEQRARDGAIPGAVVVDRNVLEWRLDPTSPDRIPQATHPGIRVIVICAEGYASSLAASSLHDLGLANATDVIGGFEAWKAAGLPIEKP